METLRTFSLAAATAIGVVSSASAGGIDIVDVRSLNAGFASCNPLTHTYYHDASQTVYFGAEIVCQATLASIKFDRKAPFT